jgi:hypothetical protein
MDQHPDNETWVVEAGDFVITKKAEGVSMSPAERLVYCLWVADYGMRNAGDLDTASDLYQGFQSEAAGLAKGLGLLFTRQSFELPAGVLQAEYFERFDRICAEVRGAFTL